MATLQVDFDARPGPTVTQGGLAQLLDCDRTTIRHYQQQGMPFIAGGRGEAACYVAPVCLHWFKGWTIARRDKITGATAMQLIAIGALLPGIDTAAEWRTRVRQLALLAGASEMDAAEACGWADGKGYARW